MITEFGNHIQVTFPTLKEANEAIAFMRAKLKESIGHWVSVYDLIGCCSLTPNFAYRFTSRELDDWGWTSIEGLSLEKGPHRGTCILTMPPTRKRGMINLKGPLYLRKVYGFNIVTYYTSARALYSSWRWEEHEEHFENV